MRIRTTQRKKRDQQQQQGRWLRLSIKLSFFLVLTSLYFIQFRPPPPSVVVGTNNKKSVVAVVRRGGFMVLGMHRSGTSLLSGLLVRGFGYNIATVGKNNITNKKEIMPPLPENPKGFFERWDFMYQNDQFLENQNMRWDTININRYDYKIATSSSSSSLTNHGRTGLRFITNPNNEPWLVKDPRNCITLNTWLSLMTTIRNKNDDTGRNTTTTTTATTNHNKDIELELPAVLFTYRHPMSVAKSLKKRGMIPIIKGVELWYWYNIRAIENSKDLCLVTTSNDRVMANPLFETIRIVEELTTKCGIIKPPKRITNKIVQSFVDPKLQHQKQQQQQTTTTATIRNNIPSTTNDDCTKSKWDVLYPQQYNLTIFHKAMDLYCKFEAGIFSLN